MPSSLTAKNKILNALRSQLIIIGGGSSGVQAEATATISSGVITATTLSTGGRGYEGTPTVTVTGNGSGASIRAIKPGGQDSVQSLVIDSGGVGYNTATITIAGPGLSYNSSMYSNVFREFKYIQEINDFPTICFMTSGITREHMGGDIKYDTIGINLRGYVMQDDAISACEDLAEDIERVVNVLRDVKTAENAQAIVDARVLEIRTDEGLYEPYGVLDVAAEITYDYETVINTGYLLLESGDGFYYTENGDLLTY